MMARRDEHAIPAGPLHHEAGLVAGLRRRDAAAVEALVAAYGDRVYRLAIHITGNQADAEEVVQDVFWSVTRKIDTFRGAAAFGSWLYRITANAAYQALRRRGARSEVAWGDLAPPFNDESPAGAVVDWSDQVDEPAVRIELRAVLTAAIQDLPVDYRLAFLLRDVEGLSNSEAADVLGISLPAVKSRVHRSRLVLRQRLTEYLGRPPGSPAVPDGARGGCGRRARERGAPAPGTAECPGAPLHRSAILEPDGLVALEPARPPRRAGHHGARSGLRAARLVRPR